MPPSLTVRVGGNIEDLKKALDEGRVILVNTSSAMDKLASKLQGSEAVAAAQKWAGAIAKIGDASKLMAADQEKANQVMQRAIGYLQTAGQAIPAEFQKIADATRNAGKETGVLTEALGKFGPMLAATFSVGSIMAFVKSVADLAGQYQDLSDKTGVGVEQLQRWDYAAKQSGGNIEQLSTAVTALSVRLVGGDKSAAAAVKTLGLNFEELRAGKPGDALEEISAAISLIPDPMQQAAIAVALFGKSGAELLPVLKANIQEVGKAASVMSQDTVKMLDDAGDAWENLKGKVKVWGAQALLVIHDAIFPMDSAVRDATRAIREQQEAISQHRKALDVLTQSELEIKGIQDAIAAGQKWLRSGYEALDPEVVKLAEAMLKQGASMSDVQETMGLTAGQMRLLAVVTKETTPKIDQAAKAFQALVDAFSGTTILAQAQQYEILLTKIGGASKLTADQQDQFRKVFEAVIEKYKLFGPEGKKVVDHFTELLRTLPPSTEHLSKIEREVGRLAELWPKLGPPIKTFEDNVRQAGEQLNLLANRSFAGVLMQGPKVTGMLHESTAATAKWSDALSELARGFVEIAQLAGDSMNPYLRTAGIVISVSAQVAKAMESVAKAAEQTGQSMTAAGAANSAWASSAATGIGLGVMFIGVVLQIAKAFDDAQRAENAQRKANQELIDSFVKSHGGLQQLAADLELATGHAWKLEDALRKVGDRPKPYLDMLGGILDQLAKRQQAAATAGSILGDIISGWSDPIEEAKTKLTEAKDAYAKLAAEADPDPLKLQEAKKLVDEWQAKWDKAISGGQDRVDKLGGDIVAAFAASFKATGDFIGSLNAIGPLMDKFITAEGDMKLNSYEAVEELLGIRRVQQAFDDILGPLSQTTAFTKALGEAGVYSQAVFDGLASDAVTAYEQMMASGQATEAQAMALVQGPLQELWEAWKAGKIQIDEATQALIEQGIAAGVVGEEHKSVQEQMLDMFKDLKIAIEDMTKAITWALTGALPRGLSVASGAIAGVLEGIPEDITIGVSFDVHDITLPELGPGGEPLPAMQHGGIVTRPTFALLGEAGPEAVVPLRNLRTGAVQAYASTGGTPAVQQTIEVKIDRETILRTVATGMPTYWKVRGQ